MDKPFNDSPFNDGYGLGMFVSAAYAAPAIMQLSIAAALIAASNIGWIVFAGIGSLTVFASPRGRWLVGDRWFRNTMMFDVVVQAAALIAACGVGEMWVAAAGAGVAVLLPWVSLPWQRRIREAHHIPDRF